VFPTGAKPTFDVKWSLQEDCLAMEFKSVDGSVYYLAPVEDLRLDIGCNAKEHEWGMMSTFYHTKPNWDRIHVLVQATPDSDGLLAVSSTAWWRGSARRIAYITRSK